MRLVTDVSVMVVVCSIDSIVVDNQLPKDGLGQKPLGYLGLRPQSPWVMFVQDRGPDNSKKVTIRVVVFGDVLKAVVCVGILYGYGPPGEQEPHCDIANVI